jgi:uncharacterized protein YuzE
VGYGNMVSVTFDPEVKALYVRILEGKRIAATIPVREGWFMDITETGECIGFEAIFPASTPQESIDAIINSSREGGAIELQTLQTPKKSVKLHV